MQEIVIEIVLLTLLAFLFGAVSWLRPDDRLRCWIAGWLCVLAHFCSQLWQPSAVLWRSVQACLVVDTLAIAGIFFVVSTMILTEGRRVALRLWIVITIPTLTCLSLAAVGFENAWVLSAAVVVRQAAAIWMAARARPHRAPTAAFVIPICVAAGGWMLYCTLHGRAEGLIWALLADLYLVAAIDFWNNGWERTVALKTIVVGQIGWATVFPLDYFFQQLWPEAFVDNDFWNIPKSCVAAGMILMVLEEDARASRALTDEYRLLFENNPHALWIFELETLRLLNVNQAALDLHGYTREEFLRLTLTDILHPDVLPKAFRNMKLAQPISSTPSRHIRKDGTIVPMDITSHIIVFQGKRCCFALALDVTEREALQDQLVHQAQHDALTGLSNRMSFEERLTEAVERAAKSEEKLAVLCMDICRFKRINDIYGPRIGDKCIQHVAGILSSHVRSMDIIARTGGDEFAIVLTGIRSAIAAEQTANDLRAVFAAPLFIEGYKIQFCFSVGLAVCPDDGTDTVALWRGAESALRRAQAAGGGQTIWLSPELSKAAEEQIEIEAYIRLQLEEGGFYLAYQPLYGFDGKIHALEALLRLTHPHRGPVGPDKFIPIAEETGLIIPLGQWVIEEVCRQLQCWQKQGMMLVPVAINVSALQLMHVDFAQRLIDTLRHGAVDPQWIHLEITETAAMRNLAEVTDQMAAISALGIAFSIDDFGTGHSSLGRLHQLPIAELKIDRSFIEQLCGQGGTYTIVQAILSMAHALGHRVVAEGVETASQLACLRDLHCDLLQGYLLSCPVPPDRIPTLVEAAHPAFAQAAPVHCDSGLPPDEFSEKTVSAS